jgi:hypothetical protein
MMLGTYRLQDPNGKELQALVHGNRLLNAYTGDLEKLEKLWASPRMKDALRRTNVRTNPELVASSVQNTGESERYLMDAEDLDEDLTLSEPLAPPTVEPRPKAVRTKRKRQAMSDPVLEGTAEGTFKVKIPVRRWQE